jgi:REP element-mobilizing transposase RayT
MSEIFGHIKNGRMELSLLGKIVYDEWFRSDNLRAEIRLYEDEFIVMPNHLHGIVWIVDECREDVIRSDISSIKMELVQNREKSSTPKLLHRSPRSLSTFLSGYKSKVTSRSSHELQHSRVWQRNYYDHIIRNEGEFRRIWDYIDSNPQKWDEDRLHPT